MKAGGATAALPSFAPGTQIPKIIHQTFKTSDLPPIFRDNIARLKETNPGWEHRFYDDAAVHHFIRENYGADILAAFERINPKYGAARADFFRYLLLYKEGGVYLDIKSTFTRPIDEILEPDDCYLLAGWRNRPGEPDEGYGMWKDLHMMPAGEFQQWHVIAAPGHPFLRAVIERVLSNIDRYKPWRHGASSMGVWRLTGPIAYSLAILPLLETHPHRAVRTHPELGLAYSVMETPHWRLFPSHYMMLTDSVVTMKGLDRLLAQLCSLARQVKRRLTGWQPD
ncbi:MAG: glycosyltransferase [Alphaproteobacteria bacterium]|nr:glycosyltransferase [Alphaproteobacteria bacterium]